MNMTSVTDRAAIQGVLANAIVNSDVHFSFWNSTLPSQLLSFIGFTLNLVPFLSDTHVPREATRFKPAPRGRSFSVGYLTWADDLILLSITVIVDMVSTVSAPRCFRSLTDAYLRPGPDRR